MNVSWYRLLWTFSIVSFLTALGSLDISKYGNLAIELKFPVGVLIGAIVTILAHDIVGHNNTKQ